MSLFTLRCFDRWMTLRFPHPMQCWSWAIVNGGAAISDTIAWLFLEPDEISHAFDVTAWYREQLRDLGLEHAVGLMTSRRRHAYVEAGVGSPCHVVATVGLSNALAAGDPAAPSSSHTINIACVLSQRLSNEAALEAIALVSEARAAAMLEASIPSIVSGRPASGTGTDCIAIAYPTQGEAEVYCGKHTILGAHIGASVREAIRKGIAEWLLEFRA